MAQIGLRPTELLNISKEWLNLELETNSLIKNINSSLEGVVFANKTDDIRKQLDLFYDNFGNIENRLIEKIGFINEFFIKQVETYIELGYALNDEASDLLGKMGNINLSSLKLSSNNVSGTVSTIDRSTTIESNVEVENFGNSTNPGVIELDDREKYGFNKTNI